MINDQSWLYQHSARCPTAMQVFLDYNPAYWCFVPLLQTAISTDTKTTWSTTTSKTKASAVAPVKRHANITAEHLANCVPTPPLAYSFSHRQWEEQKFFFQDGKDLAPITSENVDLYNATVVAVCKSI